MRYDTEQTERKKTKLQRVWLLFSVIPSSTSLCCSTAVVGHISFHVASENLFKCNLVQFDGCAVMSFNFYCDYKLPESLAQTRLDSARRAKTESIEER